MAVRIAIELWPDVRLTSEMEADISAGGLCSVIRRLPKPAQYASRPTYCGYRRFCCLEHVASRILTSPSRTPELLSRGAARSRAWKVSITKSWILGGH